MQKFFPNKLAVVVLISACAVILVSMGIRQTFGLFYSSFEDGLGVSRTEFGLAIGIQMLFWGLFAPIFGLLADKFGAKEINEASNGTSMDRSWRLITDFINAHVY